MTDCVICLSPINTRNEEIERSSNCKHFFHRQCIVEWISQNSTCPMCRVKWEVLRSTQELILAKIKEISSNIVKALNSSFFCKVLLDCMVVIVTVLNFDKNDRLLALSPFLSSLVLVDSIVKWLQEREEMHLMEV